MDSTTPNQVELLKWTSNATKSCYTLESRTCSLPPSAAVLEFGSNTLLKDDAQGEGFDSGYRVESQNCGIGSSRNLGDSGGDDKRATTPKEDANGATVTFATDISEIQQIVVELDLSFENVLLSPLVRVRNKSRDISKVIACLRKYLGNINGSNIAGKIKIMTCSSEKWCGSYKIISLHDREGWHGCMAFVATCIVTHPDLNRGMMAVTWG
ncbi:S2-RNase [Pyrus ussuriensis x Pyrus communis]|uniref:S2-RNase n=1 Tax=Pyrus ussuriensis x Pyrus communis TaxID=2448454 RepID=A0A5N5FF57_9ROSA|nr:S2-RNase [Pyrus ussuriensis x Pyrus communis]